VRRGILIGRGGRGDVGRRNDKVEMSREDWHRSGPKDQASKLTITLKPGRLRAVGGRGRIGLAEG
jgi:hypothetical protein